MATRRRGIGRRRILGVALAGAGLLPGALPAALAQRKRTKAEAAYQDTPKNGQSCGLCSQFRPPGACLVVEGEVGENGWCASSTWWIERRRPGAA